jgi:hypothetical protein
MNEIYAEYIRGICDALEARLPRPIVGIVIDFGMNKRDFFVRAWMSITRISIWSDWIGNRRLYGQVEVTDTRITISTSTAWNTEYGEYTFYAKYNFLIDDAIADFTTAMRNGCNLTSHTNYAGVDYICKELVRTFEVETVHVKFEAAVRAHVFSTRLRERLRGCLPM